MTCAFWWTYIFINFFKKVNFMLMFDVISSSNTAVNKRKQSLIKVKSCTHFPDWFNCIHHGNSKVYPSTRLCWKANIPETKLSFGKIDFNVFAVCYTELYTYNVPRVVPLGCCWLPVRNKKRQTISGYGLGILCMLKQLLWELLKNDLMCWFLGQLSLIIHNLLLKSQVGTTPGLQKKARSGCPSASGYNDRVFKKPGSVKLNNNILTRKLGSYYHVGLIVYKIPGPGRAVWHQVLYEGKNVLLIPGYSKLGW